MRQTHFERLQPFCLACVKQDEKNASPLTMGRIRRQQDDHIVEAILQCTNSDCLAEYPVIDGIPFLLPNLREYLARNANSILQRRDLSGDSVSLLGDCCGPEAAFNIVRQQISSYVFGHYSDLLPRPFATDIAAVVGVQNSLNEVSPPAVTGLTLDVGCAVGRTTFEQAAGHDDPVLGIDVNPSMLQQASQVLRSQQLTFELRRNGVVYESVSVPAKFTGSERVDFWACDATQLPFAAKTFAQVQCLNTLDSVGSPTALLQSLGKQLAVGGRLQMACPYDWSSGVTAIEQWIGGHSQRADPAGDPVDVLRRLLTEVPLFRELFELVAERDNLPWEVRLHDRSTMHYQLHGLVLQRH